MYRNAGWQDRVDRSIQARQTAQQPIVAQDSILCSYAAQNMHAEEVAAVVVEVVIKDIVAEQVAMFKLMDCCCNNSERQPDVLDIAEVDSQDNTGHEDQTIPHKMHQLTIQFPKNAVGKATNSIPVKAVAAILWIVDEGELEHLHHMFPDVTCLQDHNHEVNGHKSIVFAGPEDLHRKERDPWQDRRQGNRPESPVQPDPE